MKDGDESQTVRDSIIAAMEIDDDPVATTVEAVAEPVQAESAAEVDTGTTDEGTESRSRDEKGRFKPKSEQAENEVTPQEGQEAEQVEELPQSSDNKPPQALTAAIKAKWGELPPEIKNEFIRLEQSSANGVVKLQKEARVGRDLLGEFEPYRALIQSSGGTPQTVIRNLLNTAAVLRIGTPAQKQQAIHSIINEYGVQMGQLAPQTEPHPLEKDVQWLKQQLQDQQQTRQQQENGQIMGVINQFLEEADEKGSLKHPLDESLEPEFADEIAAVRARHPELAHRQVLEQAYERMSWKVPEIRQTLIERQQAEAEATRKEKAAQEVAKKQAAAVSLTGSAANTATSQPDSIRDLIASQVYGTNGRI